MDIEGGILVAVYVASVQLDCSSYVLICCLEMISSVVVELFCGFEDIPICDSSARRTKEKLKNSNSSGSSGLTPQ